jgi:hypothetical protein
LTERVLTGAVGLLCVAGGAAVVAGREVAVCVLVDPVGAAVDSSGDAVFPPPHDTSIAAITPPAAAAATTAANTAFLTWSEATLGPP